ncbi:MAG: type II secretion system protein [Bacilli bacterium]
MKKNGFTLVELIAVISLIAIIGLIAVPVVEGIVKRSKIKIYNTQLEEIYSAGKKYSTENSELITNDPNVTTNVCLKVLKEQGYLENTKIVDPRDDSVMNGKIVIKYIDTSKSYSYNYSTDTTGCL